MPSLHVTEIRSYMMLEKITDCESLEISQENFYDAVSFCKVTKLQCSDCNFAIERTHHRFYLEYVPKTSCFKNNKNRNSLLFE